MDFELANALGRAVERKDMSTAAHTWRVTMYAQAIGDGIRTHEAHDGHVATFGCALLLYHICVLSLGRQS